MKRKNFSEKQKALIYVRDRATCAFSTKSLWALDYGIIPGWIVDWVDHIVPCAAGGSNELDNGVCASDVFNTDKRCNMDANIFLVRDGKLTDHYFTVFGTPPPSLIAQLERLKNLELADWYFNRAIVDLFVGYECRCDKEFKGKDYSRIDVYWFATAWKRLDAFHNLRGSKSISERLLVKDVGFYGVADLLKMETITTQNEFHDLIEHIYPTYRKNYQPVFRYHKLASLGEQTAFARSLEEDQALNPLVKHSILGDNLLKTKSFRGAQKEK